MTFYPWTQKYGFPQETQFNRGTVMLASAKDCLYHPRLPTFRRMDMDTISQKLPYEHSRTTTHLTKEDFRNASVTLFEKTKQPLPEQVDFPLTETNKERPVTEQTYAMNRSTASAPGTQKPGTSTSQRPLTYTYAGSLHRTQEKLNESYPAFCKEPDTSSFSRRYQFQYIPPRVMPEQYSSKIHFVDWTGIRPIPANTYSRYRDAHPKYSENISGRSWRL